jgi:hypothetical protein
MSHGPLPQLEPWLADELATALSPSRHRVGVEAGRYWHQSGCARGTVIYANALNQADQSG